MTGLNPDTAPKSEAGTKSQPLMSTSEQQAAPPPLPVHLPTSDVAPAHLVEHIHADGTVMVRDSTTGQLTTVRLGLYSLAGNAWALFAVGPGSG
jgi:hypothetical protein